MAVPAYKSKPAASTARERKKRFSSKVRTGCVNCKARRIKCPEERPECFSCLKSGILCVYAAPETKVFRTKQTLPQAQSGFHVFEIETKATQRRFDLELVKPKSAAELRTVANIYQTLCRLQTSDIPFDTPSDKAAFGFWVACTGPRLSQYDQGVGFYKTIVPQFAWQSKAIRELAIAVVHVDPKWLDTMQKAPDNSLNQAMGHYYKALQDIKEGRTSKLETLIAAELAFTVDATVYNYKAGRVHLRGAFTLIEELEREILESRNNATYELVHNVVRPLVVTGEAYLQAMIPSRPEPEHENLTAEHNSATFKALRDQLSAYLVQYHGKLPMSTELREFPKTWNKAVEAHRSSGQYPLALREAMRLLSVIATTFAPDYEERETTYGDCTKATDHILDRVAIVLRMKRDLGKEDSELLEETLKLIMMHLFQFLPDEKEWRARKDSIESIAQEDHHVFERTTVLKTMNIDCRASSRPLITDIP